MTEREHDTLVRRLLAKLGGTSKDLIQSHISSVITVGDIVYKLKKPVDFGFLDYSTLARRKHFCEEEVRINSRFAPQLYLGVVAVTGSLEAPVLEGAGEALEYAVKMHRFDTAEQLDNIVAHSGLSDVQCDAIADAAAAMHAAAIPVELQNDFGTPERVLMPMRENFDLMASLHQDGALSKSVAKLQAWTLAQHTRLTPRLRKRREEGWVRECHGDMHLHNMALFDSRPVLFDAIEFNPYLSHIDVISDLAFLLMDLEYRGLKTQSLRVLNRYLERTGDYEAAALLPFYKTYRAMVRAKVLALHAAQEIPETERKAIVSEIHAYVALAVGYTKPLPVFLAIMHGFSGSGKSSIALKIAVRHGALRIRSDVERIRMFGSGRDSRKVYAADATEATYTRLESIAAGLLQSGCAVIVDATFLQERYRRRFALTAGGLNVPFCLLDITCDDKELVRRLRQRASEADVSEADEAVLALQKANAEPLQSDEEPSVLHLPCSGEGVEAMFERYLQKR